MKLIKYITVLFVFTIVSGCANRNQVILKDDIQKISRNVIYINLKTGEIKG
jgi:hypothetical protein